jgi:hypothetical protein
MDVCALGAWSRLNTTTITTIFITTIVSIQVIPKSLKDLLFGLRISIQSNLFYASSVERCRESFHFHDINKIIIKSKIMEEDSKSETECKKDADN